MFQRAVTSAIIQTVLWLSILAPKLTDISELLNVSNYVLWAHAILGVLGIFFWQPKEIEPKLHPVISYPLRLSGWLAVLGFVAVGRPIMGTIYLLFLVVAHGRYENLKKAKEVFA